MTVDELMGCLEACPSNWSVELLVSQRGTKVASRDIVALFSDRPPLEDDGRLFLLSGPGQVGRLVNLAALRAMPRNART
jgi:hypothetical protein